MDEVILKSVMQDIKLSLKSEKDTMLCDEVGYINVCLQDGDGISESCADEKVTVFMEGGEILGFGSANPRTEESYRTNSFTTWHGHAQIVIRAQKQGTVKVTARTSSGKMAECVVVVK